MCFSVINFLIIKYGHFSHFSDLSKTWAFVHVTLVFFNKYHSYNLILGHLSTDSYFFYLKVKIKFVIPFSVQEHPIWKRSNLPHLNGHSPHVANGEWVGQRCSNTLLLSRMMCWRSRAKLSQSMLIGPWSIKRVVASSFRTRWSRASSTATRRSITPLPSNLTVFFF